MTRKLIIAAAGLLAALALNASTPVKAQSQAWPSRTVTIVVPVSYTHLTLPTIYSV